MSDRIFFYGTLMTPFNRPGRQRINPKLQFTGRGTINAALFDLGIYPAAVPSDDGSRVWGEVHETTDAAAVLATLDEIEGYRPNEPERSLYTRVLTDVTLADGQYGEGLGLLLQCAPGPRAADRVWRLSRALERQVGARHASPIESRAASKSRKGEACLAPTAPFVPDGGCPRNR